MHRIKPRGPQALFPLTEYSGNENAMEPFGFKVIVGTAASPKKRPGTNP